MAKFFNVAGACNPKKHYMVNLESRLASIKEMVDREEYFTINKGRQYGKTTILRALTDYLKDDYEVISLDFQRLEVTAFENTQSFVIAFLTDVLYLHSNIPDEIIGKLKKLINSKNRTNSLQILFQILSLWCKESEKPIVLIIDEVDSASNNQVFLDFLAQLRAGYLSRDTIPTFQSVILAGVYDIRNIRRKIRPDEEHKHNSPWNIAAKFRIEMHFSKEEIKVMLGDYEKDYSTGMNIDEMSSLLYNYTSGYPYLVSWFCKCMDEELCEDYGFSNKSSAWTKEGFLKAHKILIEEKNPLFESLIGKFELYPELKKLISSYK
ncbi:MAG: AAA-like domain-containing protein [Firmicutes bacterium]|nr:AAA-like domain-containing protein [Bacillota bacterium]